MPIILWTDALVFLLIACGIGSGFYISRREYLLASWRRVGESRAGMAALTVLAAFILIGLLYSLHYRPRLEAVVQNDMNYYWTKSEVLERLDTKMTSALNAVLETSEKENVYMRDAAYMVAITRVVKAMELRGWLNSTW